MRVYTCTDFTGHYPVGAAAVVVAEDETQARALLESALIGNGLKPRGDETLTELEIDIPSAGLLVNGDY